MTQLSHWSLGKILVLILVGAFAGLVFDLRYEHNHVLAKHEIAWTPIICSALMVLAGGLGLARWEQGGRQMLTAVFAAGFVIGVLGVWFHSKGHPLGALEQMLSVWIGSHPNPAKSPPLLAPLAFLGIGLLGVLACSRHFSPSVDLPPGEGLPQSVHEMQKTGVG